jgi:hypothetical protein
VSDEDLKALVSEAVAKTVRATLELDRRTNGHVTVGVCKATHQAIKRGMDALADGVEAVHSEVKEQRKDTGAMRVELSGHLARHDAEEFAEVSQTKMETLKVHRRKLYTGVAAVALTAIAMLVAAVLWVSSRTEVDQKEIAEAVHAAVRKAVNGDN